MYRNYTGTAFRGRGTESCDRLATGPRHGWGKRRLHPPGLRRGSGGDSVYPERGHKKPRTA